MNSWTRLTTVVAATAVMASGYAVGATPPPSDAAPITLRIGTDDVPGRPVADQIDEFARQVDELSGGQIVIEPVWQAAGDDPDDWDQQVARLIVGGDLDMGVIPARAWDTEGVSTFRALHAPFLVTSDSLMNAVVADAVADEMLAGLDSVGITGLVLVPEGLRRVFSFGEPLLIPGDFAGATVRAPTSDTTYALFEALGAVPDDLGGPGDRFAQGVADGSVAAAESSFALAGSTLPAPTTATDVVLYPKVNVVVANTAAFDALSIEHQNVIREAAVATRDWAITSNPDDTENADIYCTNGGTIVPADDTDALALQDATSVVYDELEQDEATASIIARIRELADGIEPAQPIAPCTPEPVAPTATESAGTAVGGAPVGTEFPEGTYRLAITAEFMIDAGVDRATAFGHAGVWTMTFEDGQLTVHDVNASTGTVHEDHGTYCVENGRVVLGLLGQPPACGDFWSAGWVLDGDELQFVDVRTERGEDLFLATLFGGLPFTKIG